MDQIFRWVNGFDRNLLLKRISDCRHIRDNRCSFNANEYQFWLPVLDSSIRTTEWIGALKSRSIEQAVHDPDENLNDPNAFLDRCQQKLDQIRAANKNRYIAFFQVTYEGSRLFKSISDRDCRIFWQPEQRNIFYKKALSARETLSGLLKSRDIPQSTGGLTALLAEVDAYNIEHANEQAGNAVDKIRGLLNLMVNSNMTINPFSRLTAPHAINKFRLGPYRTLHLPDGSLAANMFWYEPRWSHDAASAKFEEDANTVSKNIRKWWGKTQRNRLATHIGQGLIRYCRALDQHDTSATLLDLWGTLEFLTKTQDEKYDITIDRIIRLFKDHNDARQVANHIKLRRNSTAHAARNLDADEVDAVLVQAELLVSQMLFFCVEHGNRFHNSEELAKFLSLPIDQRRLKRDGQIERFFLRYQNR